MQFSSFQEVLSKSATSTNRQCFVLLKVLFVLAAYFIRDLIIPAAVFALGYFLDQQEGTLRIGLILEVVALLGVVLIILKLNGSLGYALTKISMGNADVADISKASHKQGLTFFYNALKVGMLLFFGQMLLVCPCYIFQSNFVFTPFLYVYENLRGKQAKERSVNLARGVGWMILSRTIVLLFLGYVILALALLMLLTRLQTLGIISLIIAIPYLALLQSNFIWITYNEVLEIRKTEGNVSVPGQRKLMIILAGSLVLLIYILFKLFPVT